MTMCANIIKFIQYHTFLHIPQQKPRIGGILKEREDDQEDGPAEEERAGKRARERAWTSKVKRSSKE